MKNTLLILFVMSIFFASCTEKSFQVIGAVLPEPEIENNDLFDPNCVPGDVVLDSLYLNEATLSMLPYDNVSRLIFKSIDGGTAILYKKDEDPTYRREVVEKLCVNADNEWRTGSDVTEHLRIKYEGTLPSGDEIFLSGFMHKEKTWFTDKTIETGYYDDFQARISIVAPNSSTYHASAVRCTPWFDDSVVSVEDTDLSYVNDKYETVTLNGQEYENVIIGNDDPHNSEVKTYLQKDIGIIAFTTITGKLFVLV